MHNEVKEYYGKHLQSSMDLKTNACCDISNQPVWLSSKLANVHDEVTSRYYGCGLVCPADLTGAKVLDLGCGSGRDVYVLAQLVGPDGQVVGVDMTDEQLLIAEKYQGWHADRFGYSNVSFIKGYIEKLDELDLEPASFDVIVSNCVINLATDKLAVLNGIKRLLKPGGEFYFSDIYANRRIPKPLQTDPILYGECLSGALYKNDFRSIAKQSGFIDPRLVDERFLELNDFSIAQKIGAIEFSSSTFRLFNIDAFDDNCEDYGQAIEYKGTGRAFSSHFKLDNSHVFETGKIYSVCGNTWRMLAETRFRKYFHFYGSFDTHFGLFKDCVEPVLGLQTSIEHLEQDQPINKKGCC